MKQGRANQELGLTRIEVAVVIAVVAVLVFVLVPARTKSEERSQRIRCVSHLKQVGLGFRQWGFDHNDQYPMQISVTNGGSLEYRSPKDFFRSFEVLSNELNKPIVLACPADRDRKPASEFGHGFSNSNISYFVSLDAGSSYPSAFLAGDRNLTNGVLPPDQILELKSDSVVGWTAELHNRLGNIAFADGSVQALTTVGLQEAVRAAGDITNRLAIP